MSVFEKAQWIMANDPLAAIDSYYDYKETFIAQEGPVTLHISAHTNYAVYVNGQFVDCGQLPDYATRQIYDTLDLTPYTQKGENRLLITQYVTGEPFMTSNVQVPGIIFSLWQNDELLVSSSAATRSGRNNKYASKAEKMTLQLGFTFDYDANGSETEFNSSVVVEKPKKLLPRPIKKLTIGDPEEFKLLAHGAYLEVNRTEPISKRIHSAYLSAVTKKLMVQEDGFRLPDDRRADGMYLVYDLGGETIGYPQLQLTVDEPTEVLVGFGEHLEDLRVRSSCGYRHFAFRFVAKPGENLFFHPFRRIGLRYMQLHIAAKEAKVTQVAIRPTRYPMARKPMPVTDGLHKQIWKTATKTLDLCMQDYFCDCIWREQSMYAYDGRMELLACYHGFDAPEYARESLRICGEQLREDKLLEMCAPGTEPSNAPHYSAMYLRDILEYIEYTGDLTLAQEVFSVIQTIADGFAEKITAKNLIPLYPGKKYWAFYEWQPGLDGKYWGTTTRRVVEENEEDYDVPLNFYVADGFRCFGKVCEILGKDGSRYQKLYEQIADAMHESFYRPAYGGYATLIGDEEPKHDLCQGMMLYLGRVPDIKPVEALIRSESLLKATLGLSIYVYEGMLQYGQKDYVLKDLEARWGGMVHRGCDTFWETERGAADFNGAGALCQGWSSIPLYLLSHYKF